MPRQSHRAECPQTEEGEARLLKPSFSSYKLVTFMLTFRCHDGSLELEAATSQVAPSFPGEENANGNTTGLEILPNLFEIQGSNIF
jgi:hypothetical protein